MRNSINFSSIASVVCRVIASVVVASDVRTFLHLTSMRELLGLWQERRQPGFAYCGSHSGYPQANPLSGYKPDGLCPTRQYGMAAQAVLTAPSRYLSAPASDLG